VYVPMLAGEAGHGRDTASPRLTCAWRLDVTEFPAGFGHNCGALSVTRRRMKMEGVQDPDGH